MRPFLFIAVAAWLGSCAIARAGDDVFLLATSISHFCAITATGVSEGSADEGATLSCWDKEGRPQTVPKDIRRPLRVAVGQRLGGVYGDYTCALLPDEVRCWGEQGERLNQLFKRLKKPRLIAAGSSDICVTDEGLGIQCYGGEVPWTRIADSIPSLTKVRALAIGAFYACALDDKGSPRCWGGVRDEYRPLLSASTRDRLEAIHQRMVNPPETLRGATEISTGLGHACVQAGTQVTCWGGDFYGETKSPEHWVTAPRSLSAGVFRTCVTDGGKARCWGQTDDKMAAFLKESPDFPIAIAQNLEEYPAFRNLCVADDKEIRCSGRLRVKVAHLAFGYQLFNFEKELDRIAHYVYRSKAEVFRRAGKLAAAFDRNAPLPRLFILNAVRPLLESLHASYIEGQIGPRFTAAVGYYDKQYNIAALRDFGRSEAFARLSIELLHSSLKAGQQLIAAERFLGNLGTINELLGTLLSQASISSADISQVVDQMDKLKPMVDVLLENPRTQGLGTLIQMLVAYLKA